MYNFKNNNRRSRFKPNGDRGFRRNGNGHKNNGDFSNGPSFKRRHPGRNNQNASKLIEKYNNLAREALSAGDKILSENYFQLADHFTRILNDQESYKKTKIVENTTNTSGKKDKDQEEKNIKSVSDKEIKDTEKNQSEVI